MLVDSHCHLSLKDLGSYSNQTLEILENAKAKGVSILLDVVLKKELLNTAVEFSSNHSNVYNAFGVHPCDVESNLDSMVSEEVLMSTINSSSKIIGIGETGLDFYYSSNNKNHQIKSFEIHCYVASKLNKPIIVHTRNAVIDTVHVLKSFIKNNNLKGIIHCFSENVETAKLFLDLGFFISFSGITTFKNALEIQEAARFVPLDSMLVETDSPYLAPVPYRGKSNQPAYTYYVAEYVSFLKNIELTKLSDVTTSNFRRLFNV